MSCRDAKDERLEWCLRAISNHT